MTTGYLWKIDSNDFKGLLEFPVVFVAAPFPICFSFCMMTSVNFIGNHRDRPRIEVTAQKDFYPDFIAIDINLNVCNDPLVPAISSISLDPVDLCGFVNSYNMIEQVIKMNFALSNIN